MTLTEEQARRQVGAAKRIVVKIGSSLLTDPAAGLSHAGIDGWCTELAQLSAEGRQSLLVSSGAVAEGVARLGWPGRPADLPRLQAAAAVGQMGLIQAYETAFARHGRRTAMVLLTHDDLADRQRYLNARSTLTHLLDLGVIPVVNENDSVATDEIRFGDNDTLAALVANLLAADLLVVLTDVDGLYREDPRSNPQAERLGYAEATDPGLDTLAGEGGFAGAGRHGHQDSRGAYGRAVRGAYGNRQRPERRCADPHSGRRAGGYPACRDRPAAGGPQALDSRPVETQGRTGAGCRGCRGDA